MLKYFNLKLLICFVLVVLLICFGFKVGLKGGWAGLEFSIVVFFLGFIQLRNFLLLKKTYPIVDLLLLENRLLGYFVRMWDGRWLEVLDCSGN